MADERPKSAIERFGYANTVTLTRIFLIPAFLVVLLVDWPRFFPDSALFYQIRPLAAAGVFIVLALSDNLDGYLARSRGEITNFGKFIDPLADKLLVTAALLALIEIGILPAWVALIIIAREFVVSGLRMVASAEGQVIAASWYGKIKTLLQVIAIILFIVMNSQWVAELEPSWHQLYIALAWCVMGAALVMTIMSMVDYFRHAAPVLEGTWKSSD